MISSKFNFVVSAAILASTVYLLWIKIKRKSSSHPKDGSESEKCKNNNSEDISRLQSKSSENDVDSNFNAQEENENLEININEDKSERILETKLETTSCDAEINECLKEKSLNSLEFPETNISHEVQEMDLDDSILDISDYKQEIKSNFGDDFIEENNHYHTECSTVVDGLLSHEKQINMSLEDGEIIEESIEDEINITEIVVEKQEILLTNDISEQLCNNVDETIETEIEDGEIVDESLLESEFKEVLSDNSEKIIDNLSEYNLIIEKDLQPVQNLTQSVVNTDSEISSCNLLHVEEEIEVESRQTLEEIEDGEIIEESIIENDIEGSNYEKDEENNEKIDESNTFPSTEENIDTNNTFDNEELHEQRIQNEDLMENKCFEELNEEILNENDESCTIEIVESDKFNEKYENDIENNDVMDDTNEKVEEFIDKKEEFIDELMVNESSNEINKEHDCFSFNETSIGEGNLMKSLVNDANNEEISNIINVDSNDLTDANGKDEYCGNEVEYSKLESTKTLNNLLKYESNKSNNNNNVDSTSDLSQNSDYFDDAPLDNFMDYIEECLNGNESKNDENCKLENWPNDEDSLNSIKRDFYENSTAICSPHPSSESDHAHCVNNLTERVAILSAESILDNQQCHVNSSDSEMTPTLSSPTLDDSNPELYVEKITYDGKELDVVYFEEALLEEGGIQSDIKIVRTIPVGLGGRIIGKKGKTKNELLKKYGAQLLIYNHPDEIGKQILEITCSPSVSNQLEEWVNKTLEQISKNTIQTTVSNPEWLKPMIPLGRLVAAHIVDMSTVQYVKIRIFDQQIIKQFNKMQNEMNIDYSRADNTSLLPRPVAAGCVCVAMIRPDYFLRAQIVDIYEDFAWVYLFDLGKVCQTYLCYLFKIREKYMRVPFQVIPARMPHALMKNKNISPAIIYKRFLCDPVTNKPKMVRVFFPRMNTCCEPCVHIYIPMSTVSDSGSSSEEFVDLLELLVSIDVCSMVRETVNSDIQVKINSNHFKAFLNGKDKKQAANNNNHHANTSNSNVPVYFQPCNSKFYDDFIEFKSENETN